MKIKNKIIFLKSKKLKIGYILISTIIKKLIL